MKTQKSSNLKPIISIAEMASMLNLSRSRFYQLLDEGILPMPIYCIRTKRPLYNEELQEQCLKVKETNVGVNGTYILFYNPRVNANSAKKTKSKTNPIYKELAETLNNMGLNVSGGQISAALTEIYPNGIDNTDQGVVIRDLFRKLKSK
jgi:hypothetical protein